jgi:NADPH:quinone reductase-like Zn-dependent oxidoreductase
VQAAVVIDPTQPPKYQSFRDPVSEEGEVLIRVRAAGLHPIVKGLASGQHYASAKGSFEPSIPGVDGVGVLDDGRRVFFAFVRRPWGTMAELAAAPRKMLIPVPDGLDDVQAAAIANPGQSAWVTLKERAKLTAGETVLILGATGVAGSMAIQSARLLGAKRVIAAGRNVEALAGANVDAVIALAQPEGDVREAFAAEAAKGIDVVVDYLWGRPAELLLETLAKGFSLSGTHKTRWVEVGSMAGQTITLPAAALRSVDLTIMGSGFGAASLEQILAAIGTVFEMAAAGKLKVAAEAAPLAAVESAWNRAEKGGRVVFTV